MAMFASMEAAMARRQLAAPPPSIQGGDRTPNLPRSAALPAVPPAEHKKKPVVVIMGAELSEITDIKLDFAYGCDLRFYAGDKLPTETKIDYVIAYADHVTQTMQKTIKKKVQAPFNAINGGHKMVKLCIMNRTGVKPEHQLNPQTAAAA